jgi:hypothetical protein
MVPLAGCSERVSRPQWALGMCVQWTLELCVQWTLGLYVQWILGLCVIRHAVCAVCVPIVPGNLSTRSGVVHCCAGYGVRLHQQRSSVLCVQLLPSWHSGMCPDMFWAALIHSPACFFTPCGHPCPAGYAYISNVAVSPAAQRHGVASRLMAEAEALAGSWGCSKAGLHVNMNNTPAVQLYR